MTYILACIHKGTEPREIRIEVIIGDFLKTFETTDSQEVAETEQRGQGGASPDFAHGFRVREAGASLLPAGVAVWAPLSGTGAEGGAAQADRWRSENRPSPPPRPRHRSLLTGWAVWAPVCFPGLPPPGPLPGDGGFSYSFLGGLPTPSASLGAGLSQSWSGVHEGAHRHAVLSPGPCPPASSPWFRAALSVCVSV